MKSSGTPKAEAATGTAGTAGASAKEAAKFTPGAPIGTFASLKRGTVLSGAPPPPDNAPAPSTDSLADGDPLKPRSLGAFGSYTPARPTIKFG
jgi:hypothetical protein